MSRDDVPASIFRAYDIRGVVDQALTEDGARRIGRALGSEARQRGEREIVVGRDGRHSSPKLAAALSAGLCASGMDVIDIGMVPTPVLYFAAHWLPANSGVMVTGSHNGPEYNGMKIILAGKTLFGESLQAIYRRIVAAEFAGGRGTVRSQDVLADYHRRVAQDIPRASPAAALKIVADCGNGAAGVVAPDLFRNLGHHVVEMYCEVDGDFPHHHPDPSQPENLQDLVGRVKKEGADLGLAFDGDGDRLGVVDSAGNIIWPDRQLMLMAQDVLSRNPGAGIVYDVKCSRHLKTVIEDCGGRALMWKTGHSLIKDKMDQEDAPLAGELSGHIFYKERWYGFDDAVYAGARLLEIIHRAAAGPEALFARLPEEVSTPEIRVQLPERSHAAFMDKLREHLDFPDAEVIDIDGIRVEFADGWGLARTSNTSPALTLRFEAESRAALERIQSRFRGLLRAAAGGALQLPF